MIHSLAFACENYLHTSCQKEFVEFNERENIYVFREKPENASLSSTVLKILKVASYFSLVLPAAAWALKTVLIGSAKFKSIDEIQAESTVDNYRKDNQSFAKKETRLKQVFFEAFKKALPAGANIREEREVDGPQEVMLSPEPLPFGSSPNEFFNGLVEQSNLSDEVVQYYLDKGKKLLERISSHHDFHKIAKNEEDEGFDICEPLLAHEGDIKEEAVALVWYLMKRACDKGLGFDEGTFAIKDPGHRIYNYFLSANPRANRPSNAQAAFLPDQTDVFLRPSSHYTKQKKGLGDIGIDTGDRFTLPANKRTVLMGAIEIGDASPAKSSTVKKTEELTFIKPENFGIQSWKDWIGHSFEFLHSQAGKAGLVEDSAKHELWHKEHLPKKIDQFLNKEFGQKFKNLGIANLAELKIQCEVLLRKYKQPEEKFTAKKVEDLKAILDWIAQQSHPSCRLGNEVIFDFEELCSPSKSLAAA